MIRTQILCSGALALSLLSVPHSLYRGRINHSNSRATPNQQVSTPSTQSISARNTTRDYRPSWAHVPPLRRIQLNYDEQISSQQNGAQLKTAMAGLIPGDRLEIGSGEYRIESFISINLAGTSQRPIWITTQPKADVTITRSNDSQNTLNIGATEPTRFLALQNLEITGGDTALELRDCEDLWVDNCHIHHCGNVALAARVRNTARLFVTRNHVHHTGGNTAEGMYFGSNFGAVICRDSVIAKNHVHDTYGDPGAQGDGIELKQGSFGNLIAENIVHHNNFPSILVGGTSGQARNVIERNICWNSGDNTMQVQGEAIVRNNLLFDGAFAAFASGDHQGQARDMTVIHNTIINSGRAVRLNDWANRPNMVFANNACYSRNSDAILASVQGALGVDVQGNVTVGNVIGLTGGWAPGNNLNDFVKLNWSGTQQEATPSPDSPLIGAATPTWSPLQDLSGTLRTDPQDAGCMDHHE